MQTRAAVAWQAGEPLAIEMIEIEGPKAGEVLVEIKATGICHTDAYTLSGADPEGLFPAILGHEGAGIVREIGSGVTALKPGDHVIPLYTPECRQCQDVPVAPVKSLHRHPRYPGQGRDAGWHQPLSMRRRSGLPLHGLLDFFEFRSAARECARQGSRRRPVRQH